MRVRQKMLMKIGRILKVQSQKVRFRECRVKQVTSATFEITKSAYRLEKFN